MKFNILMKLGLCFVAFACVASAQAAEKITRAGSRSLIAEEVVNDYSQKAVLVKVDHEDRVYEDDDLLVATVNSDSDGYLYLFHIDNQGKKSVLIPNKWFQNNRIEANQTVQYPPKNAKFRFRVTGPNFGKERIVAIITEKQLKSVDPDDFDDGAFKALDRRTETALVEELESARNNAKPVEIEEIDDPDESRSDSDYGENYVDFETREKGTSNPSSTGKAIAFCIGIGQYSSSSIPSIDGCADDARRMADVFQKYCGVAEDDCFVMTNKDATLDNIRKIFVEILPKATEAGDVVYIFWSGHGHSVKGVRNENNSQKSEFLVPYDADLSSSSRMAKTLLHEDAFGQWIRDLSGRKVLLFLDACHSGGLLNDAKSTTKSTSKTKGGFKGLAENSLWEPFEFGMRAFSRSKALGQNDLYVLASSTADQYSRMREEGDMSVMTYVLAETIEDGSSSMTHKDLYGKVKKGVDDYMDEHYVGVKQSVVQQDDLNPGLKLKK